MESYVDPSTEQYAHFKGLTREGPIHMLNLVRLRAQAQYPDGRKASGEEAYRAYAEASGPVFARVGGKQFWVGRFECTLIGPSDERWERAFIAEYPSFHAFVEMLADPVYREAVKHRQAAVETSRLIRLQPSAPGARFGEAAGG
jgi:uncharacterized protein (DUF1330 family)